MAVLSHELLTGPRRMWKTAEIEAMVDLIPGRVTLDFGSAFGELRGLPDEPGKFSKGNYGSMIEWVAPMSSRMRGLGRRYEDADGSFLLEGVPAGPVLIRGDGDWKTVEVIAGATITVELH